MKYIANPVRVTALRIVEVERLDEAAVHVLSLEDGSTVDADNAMTARYVPEPGDYVVTQEDGYTYINPREVFERKYRPLNAKVGFAADREIAAFLRDVQDKVVQRNEKAEMAVVIYGSYGGNIYVESTQSAVEAIGVIELGKEVMKSAVLARVTVPEEA